MNRVQGRDFGLRPDDATDNAEAFDALHKYLLDNNSKFNVIVFERGVYRSSRNRWLTGVKRWRIEGNGATLREIGTSDERWWFLNHGTFESAPTLKENSRKGDLIADAGAGSKTVRLLDRATAAKYAASVPARVLVWGCNDYEGGYPPTPKFFEWNEAVAVDESTGVVTLARPLRYSYRHDWPENTASKRYEPKYASGKARLRLLSGDGFTETESAEVDDLTVAGTPDVLGGVLLTEGTRTFRARNVKVDTFIPTMAEDVQTKNLQARFMEGDKVVDRLAIEGGTIGKVSECLGIRSVNFRRVKFTGPFLARPHNLVVENCRFEGAVKIGTATHMLFVNARNGVSVELRGNTFVPPAGVELSGDLAVPPDAVWPQVASGSFKILGVAGPRDVETTGEQVEPVMSSRPGLPFLVKGKDLRGRIDYVRAASNVPNANVQFRVERAGSDHFATGDVVQLPSEERMVFRDNRLDDLHRTGARLSVVRQPSQWNVNGLSSAQFELDFAHPYLSSVFVGGYLRKLEIEVERPYRGRDRAATLRFVKLDSPGDNRMIQIDVTRTGTRRMDLRSTAGGEGADSLQRLRAEQWNGLRWYTTRNGENGGLTGTADQMPIVLVRLGRAPLP